MSTSLSERATSVISGAIGLAASLTYIAAARGIEDSLLADAVGASGVPVAVGVVMAAASAALLVKGGLSAAKTDASAPPNLRPHGLALGLVVILAIYMLVLPLLGYIVSVGLLAAAVGWFAGGRERNTLIGFAVLTGPLLWFFFDFALKIRMPAGFWPKLFTG